MTMYSPARAMRVLVSLCCLFPLFAFASGSTATDARVVWLTLPGSLLKVSPTSGSVALQLPAPRQPGTLAVEGADDTVWVYGQKAIVAYDHLGNPLLTVNLPANFHGGTPQGMAVDNTAGNIWIAIQKDLYRLDMGGELKADISLASNAAAVSLDTDNSQVWVAEQKGVEIFDASGNRLLQLSPSGAVTAFAYDAHLGQVWALSSGAVTRYAPSGQQVFTASLGTGLSAFVAPDSQGGAWVAGPQNLAYLAPTGQVQFVIQPFAGLSGGAALGLVSDAVDHSAWVANGLHLRHYDTSGNFLLEAALPAGPGNGNGLQQLGYYVDTVPPTVSIAAPHNGAHTNHNRPTITLAYSDNTGVDPASIKIAANGQPLGVTCQANADGSGASCTPNAALADGGYGLSVTVADYAGNVSTAATASFTVDTVPPAITVKNPSSLYTNQPTFTIAGSLSEAATLSINGVSVPVNTNLGFSDTVALIEGANTLSFASTDLAGNSTTLNKTLILDTVPPAVPNTGLIGISPVVNGQVTLTGGAGSIDPNTQVTVMDLGTGQTVTVVSDARGAFTVMLSARPGDALAIVATDEAGNTSSADVKAPLPLPVITVTSPHTPYTNQPALTLTGSVSEAGTLTVNGNAVTLNPDLSFSDPVTLTEGKNDFTVTAVNATGGSASVTASITLDTIPPKVPNIALINAGSVVNGQVTITGQAGATDPGVQIVIVDPATGRSPSVTSDATGAFSATLAVQAGDTLIITSTDEAGNTSSATLHLATACSLKASPTNTFITIGDSSATVVGPLGMTINFPIARTGDLAYAATFSYQTQNRTAVSGQDYAAASGTFTLPAGVNAGNLPVTLSGSAANLPDKTFSLQIQGPPNTGQTFALLPQQVFPLGTYPWTVATADLNGDGKPDVISVNSNDDTISVLLNTTAAGAAATSFSAPQVIAVGSSPSSVAVADVNGDGKPDLIVTNSGDQTVSVLLNTTAPGSGSVSFAPQQTFAVGNSPQSVAVADLNGDGKPDLVVTNDAPDNSISVLLNDTAVGATSASFAPQQVFGVGVDPVYATTADMNGDGKPDVITANSSGNTVSVLLNTTSNGSAVASFAPENEYSTGANSFPSAVVAVDLNGDGLPDLAIATGGLSTVAVMINATTPGAALPSFGAQQDFATGSAPFSLAATDMDGDGRPDLVVSNVNDDTVSILLNTTAARAPTASFAGQQTFATGGSPYPALVADMNGDGTLDVITASESDNSFSVLPGILEGVCVSPPSVIGTIHYNVVPPVITLTGPGSNLVTVATQVLTGSVSKAATLTINGTTVTLNPDGSFSYPVTLQPGANSFTLVATDSIGNVGTLTRTMVLQFLTPVGTAMQFQSGVTPGTETLVGQAGAAAAGETVTVTDVATGVTASGTVNADGSYSVVLAGGSTDNFSVVLTASDGTVGVPVYLHGNDQTLNLAVTYPTNGASINGNAVTVYGTYAGAADTGITVDGEAAIVTNGQFVANNVPLAAGANTLTVVATEEGGLTITKTLNVTSSGISPLVLSASSAVGVAPLTVSFTYQYQSATPIQTLKMSYLGNGTNDVISSDPATALSYTYTAPGIYPAMLTLIDAKGVQYQAVLNIVVQDPAQMDAIFQTVWGDMTKALASGNKAAAMNPLDTTAQTKLGPVFAVLLPSMNNIVGTFSPLLRSNISGDFAEYGIHRTSNGLDALFLIYFMKGQDGVWRLDEM